MFRLRGMGYHASMVVHNARNPNPMMIPRLLSSLSLVCVLFLAACGTAPTPIPDLTGTPRVPVAAPTYSEPAEPINRLNAEFLGYLGLLSPAPGTPSSIFSAAFAPNGTRLATLDSRQITLWDVITGRSLFASDHQGAQAVFYSPDKDEIYTIRGDGTIVVYSDEGSQETTLIGHESYNSRYAYDALNGWLALGGTDGSIRIWDVAGREAKATLTGHSDEIALLGFSADGVHLASVGYDQKLIWWDWAPRTILWQAALTQGMPLNMAIAPDNSQVALGGETQLTLYNTADGVEKASLPMPENGADDVLRYTPNGQMIVAASSRAPMTLWNAQTSQLIGQFPDVVGDRITEAFSPTGELMVIAILDKGVFLWDLTQASAQGIPRLTLPTPTNRLVGVQWSEDGYLIALMGAEGQVYLMGVPQANE